VAASPGAIVEVKVRPILRSASDAALKYSPAERGCFNSERNLEFLNLDYFRLDFLLIQFFFISLQCFSIANEPVNVHSFSYSEANCRSMSEFSAMRRLCKCRLGFSPEVYVETQKNDTMVPCAGYSLACYNKILHDYQHHNHLMTHTTNGTKLHCWPPCTDQIDRVKNS
jgi:hypothetical protein